jgi:hypothetical protein
MLGLLFYQEEKREGTPPPKKKKITGESTAAGQETEAVFLNF